MYYRTTTSVPERLGQDLEKSHIIVRYLDGQEQECRIELKNTHLEFVPRISGLHPLGGRMVIPLASVQAIEIGDEFTDYADAHLYGQTTPVVQPLAVACWLRTLWGELLRFIPQGNA